MNALRDDVRGALRALARQPMYAAVTILVLALAIGANTTVFSVFNGFFLRPLPYPNDERLVLVDDRYPKMLGAARTPAVHVFPTTSTGASRRDRSRASRSTRPRRTLSGETTPEQLLLTRASPSLFDVLRTAAGRQALHGRGGDARQRTRHRPERSALEHALRRALDSSAATSGWTARPSASSV